MISGLSDIISNLSSRDMLEELANRGEAVELDDLARAGEYFGRGDDAEALIWLERALPEAFAGLSDRVVPRHARQP